MVSTGVYKSCCKIELQKGSKIIGVLGLIGSFGNIFMLVTLWGDGRDFSKAFKDYFNADVCIRNSSCKKFECFTCNCDVVEFCLACMWLSYELHGIRKKRPEVLKTWLLAHIPALVVSVKVGHFLN